MPLASVVLAPLAVLAAPEAQLEFTVGVLGQKVVYHVQGDPFEIFGVAPALSAGPTPLAIIDPNDPRLLDVGTELLSLWDAGVLDGAGAGSLAYALPPDPGLSGIAVYAQAVTVPGAVTLVDEITNPVKVVLSLEGECHLTLGLQAEERRHHTATTLAGGKVLLAGGVDPHPPGLGPPQVLGNAELYDPQTSGFEPPFPLPEPRARHSATLLADGRVLLLGGVGAGGIPLASGTIYDPADGSFAPVPAMLSARILHTATLLADGRVFVAGGSAAYDLGNPIGYPGSLAAAASSTTEIYDPQSNTWAQGPALTVGRTAHQATLLADGRVLLSGGVAFFPGGAQTIATCRLFNPTTGTLVPTAALLEPLCFHSAVATNGGGVLVTGGGVANLAALSFDETQECEIYDPAGDAAWSFGPLVPGFVGPDGRTICISRIGTGGGSLVLPFGATYAIPGGMGDIDLLDGDARSPGAIYVADSLLTAWTTSGPTVVMRPQLSVAIEQDGLRVLITGAANTPDELSAEIWVVDY